MWPGGIRPSPQEDGHVLAEEEEEEEKLQCLRSVMARAKLIGSVPDELRRVLGSRPTTHGMARCFWGGGECIIFAD